MADLLQRFVDEHSEQRGELAALRCDQCGEITYRDFRNAADSVADHLIAKGLGRGDRVVVCTDRSADAVIAMLGVLKADMIYVPVFHRSPAERLRVIVDDAEAGAVIGNDATMDKLSDAGIDGDLVLTMAGLAPRQQPSGRGYENSADDVACILYTSGSTGAPKGVQITHRNIVSYVDWAVVHFAMTSGDRVLTTAPFNFDMSTFDIYSAQKAGAVLCVAAEKELIFPVLLRQRIEREKITVWKAIPSLLRAMSAANIVADESMGSLRHLIFSGDLVSAGDLLRWAEKVPGCQYHVGYGPTEATGMSTCHRVAAAMLIEGQRVPIGVACGDTQIWVVRDDGSVANADETGELCVSGAGVSPGYWRDGSKTRERFVSDLAGLPPGTRAYRTGDRGLRDKNGAIHFIGRDDDQVKIQGYRIELGDVCAGLRACDHVRDAEVVVSTIDSGEKILIGVVVLGDGAVVDDVARAAGRALPHYMVPRQFLTVDEIPRTERGKFDRAKLRAMFRLAS